MTTSDFIRVASLASLPQGKMRAVSLGEREVLLCHTGEGIFALDNLCSHSAARLCEGKLKGQRVLCPMHGGAFDVRTGVALSRPAVRALQSHAVRVEGEDILVSLAN